MIKMARQAGFKKAKHVSAVTSAISDGGRMGFARQAMQRSCWWRLPKIAPDGSPLRMRLAISEIWIPGHHVLRMDRCAPGRVRINSP
jgi:hypothetical protein